MSQRHAFHLSMVNQRSSSLTPWFTRLAVPTLLQLMTRVGSSQAYSTMYPMSSDGRPRLTSLPDVRLVWVDPATVLSLGAVPVNLRFRVLSDPVGRPCAGG